MLCLILSLNARTHTPIPNCETSAALCRAARSPVLVGMSTNCTGKKRRLSSSSHNAKPPVGQAAHGRAPFQDISNVCEALTAQALKTGTLQNVQVNQRCLIDKMLARYSTEFGVLRELIQNADDAGATEVSVELCSRAGGDIVKMYVSNNGRVFTETDWTRMTKIAEGNPDENTIGMFGVGFYSVFSLAEQPMIQSGAQTLLFRWQVQVPILMVPEYRMPFERVGGSFTE